MEYRAPKRTDPALWEACKEEAVHSMGKFSARAMQRAVLLYKERGGSYAGGKNPLNGLVLWGKQEKEKRHTRGELAAD
jgi:hypothetical protein